MDNLYSCKNCIYNPSQYGELGTETGFCLRYDSLLKNSNSTTCRSLRRKDLPYFICEGGHDEHKATFANEQGIVFYHSKHPVDRMFYSEEDAWVNNYYDDSLHNVALYHKSDKKWLYIKTFMSSNNIVRSLSASSISRRYLKHCGSGGTDNYRVMLYLTNDLLSNLYMTKDDFINEISDERFEEVKGEYCKEVKLLSIYGLQEYGAMFDNEYLMWVTDELNDSLLSSYDGFFNDLKLLIPEIQKSIVESSKARGTFFPK